MKKLLALLLALVMVLAITACGKSEPTTSEENTEITENVTPEETEDEIEELPEEKEEEPVKKPAEQKPAEQKPAEEKPAETPKTVGNQLLSIFKANANGSTEAIANAIIEKGNIPFSAVTMDVEEGLLNGFDNAEIKGFKSGTAFMPMMGSIAFVGYIFELSDGVSASDFISTLKSNANLRWNICVEAEEMVTGSVGNKVFFVMCPKAFEE